MGMKKAGHKPALFEASTGFEPVIKVLQTFALPLGHDAIINICLSTGFEPVIVAALSVLQIFAAGVFTGYHLATTPYDCGA